MNTNFPIHRNNFEQIRDERRTAANTAFRIGNAFLSLLGLIEDSNSDIEEQFLHSQVEDVAEEKITFRKGLQVGNRFTSGLLGEGGIFRKEADGTTYLEADKLYIRIKAFFDNVEIRDFKHSAGNRIASPAGMKCCRVEWLDANGDVVQQADANLPQVVRFRCYFRGSDGEDEVRNNFIVGDQAYCHITSVDTKADDPNSKGLNMRHYWRLVVGRNPSATLTDDGEHWIDLSNQATETLTIDGHTYTHAGYQDGSDIPVAQDDIIQLGNIYDTDRMGAIIEFVTGADAPSYQIFQDINGFDLSGKNYLSLGYSTQTGHAYLNVYGDAYIGDPEGSTYIRYEQGDGTPQHRPSLRIKAHVEFLNSDQELDDLVQNHQRDDSYDDRAIRAMIAGLQDQIDGAIDTWFFNGTPGASVLPESDWKTKDEQSTPISYNERLKHLGDLYYDNQTGYAYRYVNSGSEQSPVFSWSPISDSAVVEALAAAARAQDTADHKRRIFLSTPYPPYDAGDMWVNAVWPASGTSQGSVYNDDILKCINPVPRTGVSAFSIDDWTKASKYTDDSKFNGYINALLNGSGASGDSATAAAVQRAIISAMGGSTVVSGGLMLTSMLALRKLNAGGDPTDLNDYTTWAGINGVYDDTKTTGGIAAWYGGGMKDYETLSAAEKAHGWNTERWAKSLHRFDGSGYVAGGNISWDSAGAVTIQGTTINATNLQKGGSSVLSQAEGDARYITVSFFETLFNAMNSSGQKVSANTTTGIASIKAMFGFWTQQYISALGQGTDGGGGGQGDVTWQLLADPDTRQINITHLTTALGTLTGYTTSGKNYAVQKDSSNHLYVNVPWTDTVYTLPTASSSTKGGVKVGTTLAISSAVLNLKSDIVTAGTYTKVTVDTYGRVTAGYTLSASDIPDLRWDKITSGTPTTLSGYGITDAKIASGVITLGSNAITPVTSVAMSVPTGFSVSGSPVTKTGTLALSYASGYEGFTTTLKNRINTLWAMFTREGSGTAADPYVIKANYGLYTDSFLSALGQSSDGGGGGGQGDVTWALLASTATGGRTIDISYITNALTNGGYATQSWVQQQGYLTSYTDTKNTAGTTNKASTKMFLVGATSQAANPQTYSNVNVYIGTDNCLYSNGTKVLTAHQSLSNYVTLDGAQTINAKKTFSVQQAFSVAQGTSPFTVTSNTLVSNLNADLLDGYEATWFTKRGAAYTSSNTGTYWQKVATATKTGAGTHDAAITLIVSEHYSRNGSGILVLNGRKDQNASSLNTTYTKAYWVCRDNLVNPDDFVLTGKIVSDTETVFNLYKKQTGSWKVSRFTMVDEGTWYGKTNTWQLLDANVTNNSYSEIPSDEVQFVSVDYSAANSSDKLSTSRSLWGQSFDGTADISGNISNAGNITPSATASKNLGSDTLMFEYGYIRRINTQSGYNLRLGAAGVEYIQINASSGSVSISSAVSMSSTLAVTGATTLTGLLTANGGVVVPSSKTIKIGNAYLSYDSTNNAIRVSANADGTGAANFYAMGAVSALGAGSDSGGGGGQGDVTWALLADNNDTRQIALSHLTTALNGYATQSWVQQQGYTTNIGTVTQVKVGSTAYNPSSGVVSLPAYPTTLPASDVQAWAKATTKPSYTLDEVTDGTTRRLIPYNIIGDYTTNSTNYTIFASVSSTSDSRYKDCIVLLSGGGYFYMSTNLTGQWLIEMRSGLDGTPVMKTICLIPPATSKTVSFGYYTDTEAGITYFAIKSTGRRGELGITTLLNNASLFTIYNSSTRTILTTEPEGWTPVAYNTASLDVPSWAMASSKPTYTYSEVGAASASSVTTLQGYFDSSGAANSAVKLKTARTIWGQSFDGTANVSGAITGATTISASSNVSVGGTLGVTGAATLTGLLTANGGITVPSSKTIKIGNAYLSYDSTNNAIRVSANADGTGAANFYAMGAVSALGQGSDSGGGGGQGDVTWTLLADNNDTRQIALSHLTTALSGYATQSWVQNQGYITSYTDTKNTAGSTNTSSKIFIIGATSQAANPQTYSHDTAYVGTDGCLYSGGTKVLTAHQSLSNYVTLNSAQTISATKTFSAQQAFTVAQGTAPFTVASNTLVTSLNADLLDGQQGTYYAKASDVTTLQGYFTNGSAKKAIADVNGRRLDTYKEYIISETDGAYHWYTICNYTNSYNCKTAVFQVSLRRSSATFIVNFFNRNKPYVTCLGLTSSPTPSTGGFSGGVRFIGSGYNASIQCEFMGATGGGVNNYIGINVISAVPEQWTLPETLTPDTTTYESSSILADIDFVSGGMTTQNIVPFFDNTYDIGSSTLRYNGIYAATFYGTLSGNATTATTLQTARTIWGQSFDGSANVSGAITGATTISASSNVSVGGTLGVTGATTLTGLLTANGGITVPSSKTIKIGNAYLSYDSTNNAIRVSANADGTGAANFYAMGAVSALGQGSDSGGGGGQGDVTWTLLADNNDTRQIALSHLTTALSGYATQSWVQNQGYITSYTDTKNTAGSTNTSSKIFLIGATSQAANPQTYSHDTAYVGTDGCLYSGGTKVLTAHQSLSNYVTLNSAQTISATKTFSAQQAFTVAQGTAPFTVASNTLVTSLNADLLDGQQGTYYAKASDVTTLQGYFTNGVANKALSDSNGRSLVTYKEYSGTFPPNDGTLQWYTLISYANNYYTKSAIIEINTRRATAAILINFYNTNSPYITFLGYYGSPAATAGGFTGGVRVIADGSDAKIQFQFYASSSTSSGYRQLGVKVYSERPANWTLVDSLVADTETYESFLADVKATSGCLTGGGLMPTVNNNYNIGSSSFVYKNVYATTFHGALSGNARTATKLETARTIWGQSFDGSANVSGAITGATTISASSNVSVGGSLTVNAGIELGHTNELNGCSSSYNLHLNYRVNGVVSICNGGGDCGIGTASPSYKLHVAGSMGGNSLSIANGGRINVQSEPTGSTLYIGNSGNQGWVRMQDVCGAAGTAGDASGWSIRTSGNALFANVQSNGYVTALSDARDKNVIGDVKLSVDEIANAPAILFLWNDGRDDKSRQTGSIAQYWRSVLPECVQEKDDRFSLSYGVAALVSSIITARKVVDHERRIKELERENKRLKEMLNVA